MRELTLLLTPEEARQAVAVLEELLAARPSRNRDCRERVRRWPESTEGGTRIVRPVVYADAEERHDLMFE